MKLFNILMMTLALFIFAFEKPVLAHNVIVFAWIEGDTVYTESKFSGGRKAKNALVEVFNTEGSKLLEGRTDGQGEFSFKVPGKTGMRIVLQGGMGHRGEWTIPAEEVVGEESTSGNDSHLKEEVVIDIHNADDQKTMDRDVVPSSSLTSEDIEAAVERAVDKKLTPIITKLNKSLNPDKKTTLQDILGGIGYIIGLIGIGAYFNSRKREK